MKDYSKRIEGVENMVFEGRLSKSIVLEACKKVEHNQPKVVNYNGGSYKIFGNIIVKGKTEINSFAIREYDYCEGLHVTGWTRNYHYKNGKVEVSG